jgi:hypothetical protein
MVAVQQNAPPRLLGHDVAESTVSKYLRRPPKPPSQTWRTFLANHAHQIFACDYYHNARAHLSLERNLPNSRVADMPTGRVVSKAYLGGLHHLSTRVA